MFLWYKYLIVTFFSTEKGARKALYKKYKRGISITDGVDTALISAGVILASIGLVIPVMLPLEICAIVCGTSGASIKISRRKLMSKAQKHYEIKTMGQTKLNTIKNFISKALNDGQCQNKNSSWYLMNLTNSIV